MGSSETFRESVQYALDGGAVLWEVINKGANGVFDLGRCVEVPPLLLRLHAAPYCPVVLLAEADRMLSLNKILSLERWPVAKMGRYSNRAISLETAVPSRLNLAMHRFRSITTYVYS